MIFDGNNSPKSWIVRLDPDQRKRVDEVMWDMNFNSDQMIYDEGSAAKGVYLVKEGIARLASFDKLGRERVIGFVGTGMSFGESSLFAKSPHRCFAIAQGDLRIGFLPGARLLKLTAQYPDIAGLILETVAWRHSKALETRLERERLGLEERVASTILKLLQSQSVKDVGVNGRSVYPMKLTQSDIASVLGSSRQSINKILGRWCEEGIIRLEYGRVIVTAVDKLLDFADKTAPRTASAKAG